MNKKEIEDRFKEEKETIHELYNVTLETLENQEVADFSLKNSRSKNVTNQSDSHNFVPKKHPIQIKETASTNGYYENQFTYIPGYLIPTEGNKSKEALKMRSESTSNLIKGSRPTSALHTMGSNQAQKMFSPNNFDDV
jgi:hypothetical protein